MQENCSIQAEKVRVCGPLRIDSGKHRALGYPLLSHKFAASAARARGRLRDQTARPSKGIADGRGPQDGQIRTLLALRGSLRSEADAGARVLRRAERARGEGAEALRRVRV